MGIQLWRILGVLALTCFLSDTASWARNPAIPKDVDGFTQALAERFATAAPGSKVGVKGPLVLEVGDGPDKTSVQLNAVWDYCQRERRQCAHAVKEFVASMTGTISDSHAPMRAENIRLIVRGPGYIDDMRKAAAAQPEAAGIFRPITGRTASRRYRNAIWRSSIFPRARRSRWASRISKPP
jgi:hypothetical protein